MVRTTTVAVATLLALMVFLPIPLASADHDWGHRYMVYGRVIDSEGEPAQHIAVRVLVETNKPQDPYITVTTDCKGLYYTLKDQTDTQGSYGQALDWGTTRNKMHIHMQDYVRDGKYHVMVLNNTGELFSGAWAYDPDRQRSDRNVQLTQDLEPSERCAEDDSDWTQTYVVSGRIQTEAGAEGRSPRHDAMTVEQLDERHEVTVTITTPDGPKTLTVATNEIGDYFAIFDNVTVTKDSRITMQYQDVEKTSGPDMTFRVTHLHAFVEEPLISQTTLIVLGSVAGLIVVGGGAYWAFGRVKESAELKKALEGTTRKRARR
ncbi:MAG: hypothetical protein KY455_09440 [Euryarchaeota archaeon]|nr:hypothetical protein [Euryarchaeota archaeon]